MAFTDPRTDETFAFPVLLHEDLQPVAWAFCRCYHIDSIDEADAIIEGMHEVWQDIGEGEGIEDDLYRLCVRIRDAWQAQRKY